MEPKYKQIADLLEKELLERRYRPGDRIETESELMQRMNVSRQTIRHAISLLEKRGYLQRRQGSGMYVLSTVAPAARTKRIAFIATYLTEYILPSIIRGTERVISATGYTMQLSCTSNRLDNEKRILAALCENPPDGIIAEGTKTAFPNPNISLYHKLEEQGVPIVFANAYYSELQDSHYVVVDDRGGGRQLTRLLLDQGHQRICGIFKADDLQGHERFAGFSEAMVGAGLDLYDETIFWFTTETQPYFFRGETAAALLNAFRQCTAAICYNDQIAAPLIQLLTQNGIRVPEDVTVVSFDNSSYARYSSRPMISLEHPKDALGQAAAEMLFDLIAGKAVSPVVLPWGAPMMNGAEYAAPQDAVLSASENEVTDR